MPSERMGRLFIWSLLVLFCLILSCLILLWSSSSPPTTAGTWWEAAATAVHSQKSAGFFTGGPPPGNNNSPSQPHGEEANHHLPSWLFSTAAAACPAPGAGEAPASGCIDCQGDRRDQVTFWLLMWLRTCALVIILWRCAKLMWAVFVLMVRTLLEAKMRARPGPPAPVLRDNDEEGAPANVAEPAPVPPPPQQQRTENVPDAAGEAGRGAEVEPSPIAAAVVTGSALLLSLMPPPPLPRRSISAPARLISTPVAVTAENNTISGDVSPATLA